MLKQYTNLQILGLFLAVIGTSCALFAVILAIREHYNKAEIYCWEAPKDALNYGISGGWQFDGQEKNKPVFCVDWLADSWGPNGRVKLGSRCYVTKQLTYSECKVDNKD